MERHLYENLIIRKYQPGNEIQIVDLLKLTLNWPSMDLNTTPVDHWKWKFIENPIKQGIVILCELDGEVVGCSHVYFTKAKLGDKIILCGNGVDVAVHPDFRRRGIFDRMTHAREDAMKEEGVDIAFWSTANPILQRKWRSRSKAFPIRIDGYVKPYDLDKILATWPIENRKIIKYGYRTLGLLNRLRRRKTFRDDLPANIAEDPLFDKQVDDLWETISPQSLLSGKNCFHSI